PLATQKFPERANGPVRATLVSEAPVALVLVTTRCPSGLVVPMATDPKDRLLGDTEKEVDGGGGVFETVTVTLAEVAVFPAASRAVTVSRFVPSWRAIPLAVQLVVPLAAPLPPRLLAHVTWVTPTLSDAVPPSVRGELLVLYVDAVVGAVMAMVGAMA